MEREWNQKILVTRSSMPPFEEYVEAIRPIWESAWLTNMGVNHKKLEEELRDYLSVPEVSLFTNGHMALELCIQAMGLEGEVITTPFTFVSTVHAIVRNNLTPVFCDINERDYTIDVDKLEDLITDKTSAIVPVHVYGHICDVERIEEIAKKHKLKVIYDAAHAFGVRYKGMGVGSFGDASMFSFHATKVYNTIEGGAIATDDKDLIKKLYSLKNFGIKSEVLIDDVGANAKMNEFAAAMGLCNLLHVDDEIKKREKVYKRYMEKLSDIDGLILDRVNEDTKPNYAYFPVIFDESRYKLNRDQVYELLKTHNIFSRKYFYPLINETECYKGRYEHGDTQVAKRISERVLTLPMYAGLDLEIVDNICEIIRRGE
ncbi:MAG: DegT/DnrJ/EryC1/StrS family aminotransferase [Lachnospiraceae bacterium]|nr:DegT/DnrJ/EryC1/StrS family aminotransferase [Lachnospiraceae bacterium]